MKTNLIGKFFHNFDDDGFVRNQGVIKAFVNEDIVLVDYFEWAMGSVSSTNLVWLKEIVDGKWSLYDSAEDMSSAYEHGLVKSRSSRLT